MLNTPAWWYKKRAKGAPPWRPVLWPLSLIWQGVNGFKRDVLPLLGERPYRSSLFVISVGNLTLGGSGKTPIAAEILRLLANTGLTAAGLSRGHGGTTTAPVKVDPEHHTAAEVGDEALMLAQDHPMFVARDRAAGLRLIEGTDTALVVVDDAHQNLKIAKDVHVLVVDGDTRGDAWPFGDGGVCPYGPLREPQAQGLARADICVLWLPDETTAPDPELLKLLSGKPVFIARLTAHKPENTGPVTAFAAIAKPWKFEATLKNLGLDVRAFTSFPDHAALTGAQLEALQAQAETLGSRVITTAKDWVKLDTNWRARIDVLTIEARFEDTPGFLSTLLATFPHS